MFQQVRFLTYNAEAKIKYYMYTNYKLKPLFTNTKIGNKRSLITKK